MEEDAITHTYTGETRWYERKTRSYNLEGHLIACHSVMS